LIDTYDALPYNINRVDFVRYAYLYVHGGIYADLDCECIKSLDTLKKKKETEIILAYDSLKHLECAFMISTPKQPLWLHVLHEIHKRLYEPSLKLQLYGALSRSTYILNLTGPSMLEAVLKSVSVQGVEIFPSDAFYPKQWNDTTHHDGRAIATAQTYVVHHMTGSWISPFEKYSYELIKWTSQSSWRLACVSVCLCAFIVFLLYLFIRS
jgi:inositol phosphorylceramide mannosyltransferase catalytic subunit